MQRRRRLATVLTRKPCNDNNLYNFWVTCYQRPKKNKIFKLKYELQHYSAVRITFIYTGHSYLGSNEKKRQSQGLSKTFLCSLSLPKPLKELMSFVSAFPNNRIRYPAQNFLGYFLFTPYRRIHIEPYRNNLKTV